MPFTFTADSETMPTPSGVKTTTEAIWSSDTGRTMSGKMTGSKVAEKKTVSVSYNLMTAAQLSQLKTHTNKAFFNITITDVVSSLTVYRGDFDEGDLVRLRDGTFRRQNVTINFIEK